MIKLHGDTPASHDATLIELCTAPQNRQLIIFMSCSIVDLGNGFVIKSAGFTLRDEPAWLGCPLNPQVFHIDVLRIAQVTKHIVASPSTSRFRPHTLPRSSATLWTSKPSHAVLTVAYSSLSAVDSDTTCCFLVHTLRQSMSTSHDHSR